MSPDALRNPSAHWKAFLQDVDQLLQSAVELHCLGGFVLSVLYDLPRPTADVDYIAAMPSSAIAELETIAGHGSALHKKHGMYLQHVTIADVPEDFAARLTELFPGSFARLRLFALDVHDLVLTKLARNSPVDLEDAKFLAKAGRLDERILRARYAKEMRPYLTNESRHDLTLKLWLEACFPS
jgi:hypothetical protein